DGTVLEGLQLIYGSQAAEQSTNTVTQGIGDRIYNILDGVLNSTNGTLLAEYEAIEDKKADIEKQITKIEDQIEKLRDILLLKFAALERAIVGVNALLQNLSAND